MKKYTVQVVWVVVALVALGGGYYWGRASGPAGSGAFNGGAFGSSTRRFAGAGGGNGQTFTAGAIIAMDSSSITLQLPNGNSQVIFFSGSTSITEPTAVAPSALRAGTNVTVGGTANADGSLTAQTIQVRTGAGDGRGGLPPSGTKQ